MDPFPFQLELSAEHAVSVCNHQHLRQTPEVSQQVKALAVSLSAAYQNLYAKIC